MPGFGAIGELAIGEGSAETQGPSETLVASRRRFVVARQDRRIIVSRVPRKVH